MQDKLSDILENILGLMLLEGSYDISEDEDGYHVEITTDDAGRIIGFRGESLSALQLIINQMITRGSKEYKRVVLDVVGWKKQKEEELAEKAKYWASQVIESKQEMQLEPMPSWQRRIIHMVISETDGVESESVGEGKQRHLIIRPSK